jgi:hypothetical protein
MNFRPVIWGILLILCSALQAQPLVGLSKDRVEAVVREQHRDFRKDQSVVRQQFNYLKYVNGPKTRTWIAYFSDQDTCTGTKLVCDYSEFDEVVKELNEAYKKTGRKEWEYTYGSDTFRLTLAREEWYFTVREKKKE